MINTDKLFRVIITLGTIATLSAIFIYLYKFGSLSLSAKKDDWDLFSQYIGSVIGQIVSILTLIVTSWIALTFNRYQIKQQEATTQRDLQKSTIDLFRELRNENFRKARDVSWEVRKQWDQDIPGGAYRTQFIISMLDENPYQDDDICITQEHIDAVYELFAFYTMLGVHQKNEDSLKSLNYFYYAWWRKFLYEIATAYDVKKTNKITIHPDLRNNPDFDQTAFSRNISLTEPLIKLDIICGFQKLSKEIDIYA